jgi:MFS family permease
MNYGRIVNRSFEIAWRYKSLWIFGLFASGGMGNFNFNVPTRDITDFSGGDFRFFDIPQEIYAMFMLSMVMVGLAFFVASIIAEAAVTDSVNRIERGGIYKFADAFSTAIDFFWRLLGLALVGIFGMIVPMFILALIAGIGFGIHTALGILSLLVIIPAMIFWVFTVFNILTLTQRVIIVRNTTIGNGLEEAYHLFKSRFSDLVVIFLIFIAFTIGFGIASAIIWFMFGLPVAALGLAADLNPIAAFFGALVAGLPISLVVGGFLGVFYNSLYTLTYFELVEPKQDAAAATPATPSV